MSGQIPDVADGPTEGGKVIYLIIGVGDHATHKRFSAFVSQTPFPRQRFSTCQPSLVFLVSGRGIVEDRKRSRYFGIDRTPKGGLVVERFLDISPHHEQCQGRRILEGGGSSLGLASDPKGPGNNPLDSSRRQGESKRLSCTHPP